MCTVPEQRDCVIATLRRERTKARQVSTVFAQFSVGPVVAHEGGSEDPMRVRAQHTYPAPMVTAPCRQWLPLRTCFQSLATAALICAAGCAGSSERVEEPADPGDTSGTDEVADDEPLQTALHNGVFATPETVGGFSTDGVGVYLSAVDNMAELTLYVVAPAQSATFRRPALYLTTQEDSHSKTEVAEFDDITIEAGESRVFREKAGGTLMEVFADFAGE
jgi:hypothetical protein